MCNKDIKTKSTKILLLCPLRGKISNHLPSSYINYARTLLIFMLGEKPISRRHFLKLVGYLGIVSLGGFAALRELYQKQYPSLFSGSSSAVSPALPSPPPSLLQTAFAQTTGGSWSLGPNTAVVAIHAALTYTGKIFYYSGSGNCINNQNGLNLGGRLLDPNTGAETSLATPDDLWCGGAAQLPNGNILFVGGTILYDTDVNNCNGTFHGANYAYELDVSSGSLVKQTSMAHGRWYPTLITLPNGNVIVVSGNDEYGSYNSLAELYNSSSKSWTIQYDPTSNNTYCVGAGQTACPGAGSPCFGGPNQGVAFQMSLYPRMYLMPSGLVFTSGQQQNTNLWDPVSGAWTNVNLTSQTFRDYGTSILLPLQNTTTERGKVMIVGGSTTGTTAATAVVEIEDFNQGTSTAPVLRTVASLNVGRKFVLPIILPNGKVVVFGGTSQGTSTNYVYVPEMFDPENEAQGWVTLPAATVGRVYHGTALLLPDGSVWTASSTPSPCTNEYRTEIFKPSYFSATRPTISGAPTVGDYGQSITIPTPNPSSISRVSLVGLGATTHHFDTHVRLIWLQITGTSSNTVTVSAPLNGNLAPPGYYMIHVLDSSLVPSTAQIIKIPGTGSGGTPAQVTGLNHQTVSSTQINLSWNANPPADNVTHYNIYRSTTSGFTPGPGNLINSTVTATSFQDSGLTASTTYYYKVSATNSVGEGPVSSQASAQTTAAPPPAQVTGLGVTVAGSTQLNLSWTANTDQPINHYNVYRSTTNGFTVNTATDTPIATPTANSYSNTGLASSTTYYYRVAAVNNSGLIGPVSAQASAETGPAQVTGVTISSSTTTYQLNLSWTAGTATDLNHYNVYRSTTNGFTVNTATDTPIAKPTTNSFTNTGLTYSTTYYYRIAAVNNAGGIGTPSAQASGTTKSDTTSPNLKISSPANAASVPHGNLSVTGTSSDDVGGSGINNVQVKVDSGTFTIATPRATGNWSTWSIIVSITTTGSHTISAKAIDKAGNTTPPSNLTKVSITVT
jgi:galactose oxidase-like protein/fibronectin type III domain protein